MSHITVLPGGHDRRVPLENQPHAYFDQEVPATVRRSRYIDRRLADGDLIKVDLAEQPPALVEPEGDR